MLDLDRLEQKLDDALSKETEESLKVFLNKKRTPFLESSKPNLGNPHIDHRNTLLGVFLVLFMIVLPFILFFVL